MRAAGVAAYVRGLDPQLPRAVWTLEAGTFVNFFGSGIAFPYLLIYLHNVRGFGLGTAGLVVAAMGAVGIAAGRCPGRSSTASAAARCSPSRS